MRALLVVNPHATTTTVAGRDVLARALAGELKLEVLETAYRGHAAMAAEQAAQDGVELVIAHGGDGTVNEVVNGLLVGCGGPPAEPADAPSVAVVPGGSANVFARALGIPRDPLAATSAILAALAQRRSRLVGLGRVSSARPLDAPVRGPRPDTPAGHRPAAGPAPGQRTRRGRAPDEWAPPAGRAPEDRAPDGMPRWMPDPRPAPRATEPEGGRWFTFNAGLGWDADVVAAVERARADGHPATPLRYARTALLQYLRQLRNPRSMTVEIPGAGPVRDLRLAFVSNTDTWTYLGSRPVRTNPGASFTSGLGLFGLRELGASTIAPTLRRMLRSGGDPRGRNVLRQDALPLVTIRSAVPVALQVDGDHLGEHTTVEFRSVPDALRVVV